MLHKIALVGNPNCGKTSLFNIMTGANQSVGNWPGVTVEKKEGRLVDFNNYTVVDLPGIYSLSPYTPEEIISRNYLLNEKPDVIINIIDGTNFERNLYLTTQLKDMEIPIVVAVNMIDVINKKGDKLDTKRLSKLLQCAVIEISALKNNGIDNLISIAIELTKSKSNTTPVLLNPNTETALKLIENESLKYIEKGKKRFYAIKIFERDKKISAAFKKDINITSKTENIISKCELAAGDDSESIIINDRYTAVAYITRECYKKSIERKTSISDRIDNILTNKYLALPIFALIMFAVYFISVTSVGNLTREFLDNGVFGNGFIVFNKFIPGIPVLMRNLLDSAGCAVWVKSLLCDGIIQGVGAVLGFVPQMLVLFFLLSFLEACGYMSRIAFIMDRVFRKFGLSGKSFIPMLVATGCGVPGIMASRTIENIKERRITIITATFMPCGAKLPVIALVAGAMFGGSWWVAPTAYFAGMAAVAISGIILNKLKIFFCEDAPFIMELPEYHMPTLKNLLKSMWERGWAFIKKAGSAILLATVVIWFTSSFGFVGNNFVMVKMEDSVLATIGKVICPLFIPLGFGNWQAAIATISGIAAKENIVGTFGVLFGGNGNTDMYKNIQEMFTVASAFSFLLFNLLCAPCIAAISAISKEMNSSRWTAFAILYQCMFAYIISLIVYNFWMFILNGTVNMYTMLAAFAAVIMIYMMVRKKRKGRMA